MLCFSCGEVGGRGAEREAMAPWPLLKGSDCQHAALPGGAGLGAAAGSCSGDPGLCRSVLHLLQPPAGG